MLTWNRGENRHTSYSSFFKWQWSWETVTYSRANRPIGRNCTPKKNVSVDILIISEQNFGFPPLQAHLTSGPIANVPTTRIPVANTTMLLTHISCVPKVCPWRVFTILLGWLGSVCACSHVAKGMNRLSIWGIETVNPCGESRLVASVSSIRWELGIEKQHAIVKWPLHKVNWNLNPLYATS